MSAQRPGPLFLARSSFRLRRLRDAARMLPIVAAVLMLLPLLKDGDPDATTAGMLLYLFGLWIALVALSALLSGVLAVEDDTAEALRREEDRGADGTERG